jgi:WD40 repeat protein
MLFDEQRGLEFRSHHDGGTPSLLLDPFDGPRKTIAIRDSAFYPIFACDDGALLVCPDGIVEVRSGKCLAKILIHSGRPYDQRAQNKVAVDDRCRMFAICDSNAVVVWKLEGSGETLTCSAVSTIPCDTNDIHALRLSPDGTRLFVLCKSGVVRLMRTDKAAPPLVIRRSEAGFAGMDISADGRYLVTVDAAGKIEGLDAGRSLTPTAP